MFLFLIGGGATIDNRNESFFCRLFSSPAIIIIAAVVIAVTAVGAETLNLSSTICIPPFLLFGQFPVLSFVVGISFRNMSNHVLKLPPVFSPFVTLTYSLLSFMLPCRFTILHLHDENFCHVSFRIILLSNV